jgi:hypothetical protein
LARYSFTQLEALWTRAGGPKNMAPVMAAIALAESSGDSNAHNPSGASGLWQILGNPFPGNAFDPLTNARMAVAKWRSQGLQAWVTYTSGAYRKFLPAGAGAVPGGHTGVVPGASGGGGPGIGGLLTIPADVLRFFTGAATAVDWLLQPSHWVRIFCGLAGGWGVLAGVWMLTHAGGSAV